MIAYFDCFSGISGDMTLGALIDLGVDVQWLNDSLFDMPLKDFQLSVSTVSCNGIQAKSVDVAVKNSAVRRNYADIVSLIEKSSLSTRVKETSLAIFDKIAVAESGIHGCKKNHVHFHEVGGVDAIVDIVGTALCIEYLGIDKIISSNIPLGSGVVSCMHGQLPVPSPATLSILQGVPVYGSGIKHEIVTPTGAAIIASLSSSFQALPDMYIKKTGYGAGKRVLDPGPNLLRVITGLEQGKKPGLQNDEIVVIETSIDNMNPEIFGFLMDRLFEDGALDVCWIPVFMKKNRPGTLVQVLCPKENKTAVIERILSETTSLGVRYHHVKRSKLVRKQVTRKTPFGEVQVKSIVDASGVERFSPEYDVCRRIAVEKNIPLKSVYEIILTSFQEPEFRSQES